MTTATVAPRRQQPPLLDPDDFNHYFHCDENTAFCGHDLTGCPVIDWEPEEPDDCPLCVHAWREGWPCPVPGCERRAA